MKIICTIVLLLSTIASYSQVSPKLQAKLDEQAKAMESKVIEWRRHFHEFPELSNRETNTGKFIAEQLAADTISKRNNRMDLPDKISIPRLADTDKRRLLKYIYQVKTLFMEYLRDNLSEKKLAEETLELVTGEYAIK